MFIKKLSEDQVYDFDYKNINPRRWKVVKNLLDNSEFNYDRIFSFLDIGGGNGRFTDKVLETYPNSRGTVLDNSEYLLSKNIKHKQKSIICASVENMEKAW